MTPKDHRLERSIEIAQFSVYAAKTPDESRHALDWLKRLIDQRSPEMVREIADQKAGKG